MNARTRLHKINMPWTLVAIWLAVGVSLRQCGAADAAQGPKISSLHITSNVQYHYATTLVTSVYVNPSNQSGEASFIVTLPDTAFISDFSIKKNGNVYQLFKANMEKKKQSSVEPERPEILNSRDAIPFTIAVKIEPQGMVAFSLTYEEPLTKSLGVYTNILNINSPQIVDDLSARITIEEQSKISHLVVSELQVPTSTLGSGHRVALAQIQDLSPQKKEVTWAPTIDQQKGLGSLGIQGQLVIQYDVDQGQNRLETLVNMLLSLVLVGIWLLVGVDMKQQEVEEVADTAKGPKITSLDMKQQEVEEVADTAKGPKITSLHITSTVKHQYATTLVSSIYVNRSNQTNEASFIVTLPDTAFVSDFSMEKNGKVYKAKMEKKEQCAVYPVEPKGPEVLSARDLNQFTITVNIEPQGNVKFNLTYGERLTRKRGFYTNAISISPQQIVDDLSVIVCIEEQAKISVLEVSELHVPTSTSGSGHRFALAHILDLSPQKKEVTWAPTTDQQKELGSLGFQGQLIIQYDVERDQNPLQTHIEGEYFSIVFAPDFLPQLMKHIVFVLDYSGSMSGQKLSQLKEAMKIMLTDFQPSDYFSIVIFHDYEEVWCPKNGWLTSQQINGAADNLASIVESSSENIKQAIESLNNYKKNGNTNIFGGLKTGLELVNISSGHWQSNGTDSTWPIIFFLTDGQPNKGVVTQPDAIVKDITAINIWRCAIYSLGFGYDADLDFLRKLSLSNNGFARPIYVASDASTQLSDFYDIIASPLLINITFVFSSSEVNCSTTTNFPVFTRGSENVVCGKIMNDTQTIICEVTGLAGNKVQKWEVPICIPSGNTNPCSLSEDNSLLEESLAYLSIQQQLEKATTLDDGDDKTRALEEASNLSVQYSFATSVTSLVVPKPDQTETVVNTVPVKAGDWSYSQVDQPSTTKNYTSSEEPIPVFNVGCSIIISAVLFYFDTYY